MGVGEARGRGIGRERRALGSPHTQAGATNRQSRGERETAEREI